MSGTPVAAALLAALSQEVRPFLRRVGAKSLPGASLPAWEFAVARAKGVLALSGMGADAAARAAAWIFKHYQPQVFVSLGFGGAVTPELSTGDLVLGETFWRYDPDAGGLLELPGPASPVLLQELVDRLRAAGLRAFQGSMVATPAIIPKVSQRSPLLGLPHPVLDLETGAAAVAAQSRNLPFLALRAITDPAAEEIPDFIRRAAREGISPGVATALVWLAADPRRLPRLVRLWRRSRLAALRLARALEVVLEML